MAGAVLAFRFFLEVSALLALGYWGFSTSGGTAAEVALGMGAPLLAALAWGTFVAPRRLVDGSEALRLVVEMGVFGSAAVALVAAGHLRLGWALAAAAAAQAVAVRVLRS
jgi:hypothetical protein